MKQHKVKAPKPPKVLKPKDKFWVVINFDMDIGGYTGSTVAWVGGTTTSNYIPRPLSNYISKYPTYEAAVAGAKASSKNNPNTFYVLEAKGFTEPSPASWKTCK